MPGKVLFPCILLGFGALAASAALGCDSKQKDTPSPSTSSAAPSVPVTPGSSTSATPATSVASSRLPKFDPSQLLPFVPIPEGVDKPVFDEASKLGHMLYFDSRLSVGGDVACSTCHDLARAGVDGEVLSTGSKKQKTKRNTPTVLNAAGAFAQGWDARSTTVEEFVLPHMIDPSIMGMGEEKRVVALLSGIVAYTTAFKRAFPDETAAVSAGTVGRALGAYLKKLFARARWDRYLAGDKVALTPEELDGLAMFVDAGCTTCHQGKWLGATQSQKLGIAKAWPAPAGTDPGRFDLTKQEVDRGMFKVPTLRNVTRTAPYLHDGSVASLDEVIRGMSRHQVGRELTDAQTKAILVFLGTLTGDPPKEITTKPGLPPADSLKGR